MTRQCFDEYHRLFGIRYPFGDYHQAFVPEFNAGAMENPGCVTYRDPYLFPSRVTRGARVLRATTVAHEMAHQWFGNIVTPKWWDDLWLNESFAEYLGNRVTADVTEYDDAWVHLSYQRRQWGLTSDQRPSTHPVAGNGAADAPRRAAGLRRHLVRQGREHPAPGQRDASATRPSSPASSTTSPATASATPPCTTCSRAGSAPAPATCPRSPASWLRTRRTRRHRAGPGRRGAPSDAACGAPRRPPAPVHAWRQADGGAVAPHRT